MGAHKHGVTCPACGGTIHADNEDEIVQKVQTHAKEDHGMDLTREKVLEMEKSQSGK